MRIYLLAATLALAAGFAGCATKTVTLPPSTEQPAAMGQAKVSTDANGNTRIRLDVQHFAQPQRLQPPRSVYVVWLETPNHDVYNLGQLRIADDLTGRFETVTPYQAFQLLISAEDSPEATAPGPQVVLTTRVLAP